MLEKSTKAKEVTPQSVSKIVKILCCLRVAHFVEKQGFKKQALAVSSGITELELFIFC